GNPGVLYLGDVGYTTYEELNVVTRPGMNFGWPIFEGLTANSGYTNKKVYNYYAPNPQYGINGCTQQYFYFQDLIKQETSTGTASFSNPCNTSQGIPNSVTTFVHSRPVIDWQHGTVGPSRTGTFNGQTASVINIGASGSPVSGPQFGGNAAIAGVFYTHSDFPSQYRNTCFFGDYAGNWIRSIAMDGSNKPVAVNNFASGGSVVVSMAIHPTQTGIYYINYPSEIKKISYNSTNSPPTAVASADKTFGSSPLTVQFTGNKSTDPEGQALAYAWDFGDGSTSNEANPSHTFTSSTSAKFTVTLTVTDNKGATDKTTLVISLGNNTPPSVTITSPAANTLYPLTKETVYNLRATVTDQNHSNSQLTYKWQTILHHQDHEHAEPFDNSPETTTTISPVGCDGETYYYRIVLIVTDPEGLSGQDEVRIYPDCNSTTQRVTNFTLINSDNGAALETLHEGSVVDLSTLPTKNVNIRANTSPTTVGSVVLNLSGAQTRNQTETEAPYSLFGDTKGNYFVWNPIAGTYTLKATPYSGAGGSGTAGTPLTITFRVINQPSTSNYTLTVNTSGSGTVSKSPNQNSYASGTNVVLTATPATGYKFSGWSGAATGTANPITVSMTSNKTVTASFTPSTSQQQVVGFTLINATTDQPIQALGNGAEINIYSVKNLNIRANTNPGTVGSVKLKLSGAQSKEITETVAPYALFGDINSNYNNWTPAVGNYTLTATPYSGSGGGGTAGSSMTITFNVVNRAPAIAAREAGKSNQIEAEILEDVQVNYFPNPFTQEFTLQIQNNKSGTLPIEIIDPYGKLKLFREVSEPNQTLTLGKELSPGMYIVTVGNGHNAKRIKIIKSN
ncbi:MAG: PKD domain-containing protein, partial [Bacteroidota bacterium]|nr:PKD domain-containing protein [Bacteroidota bacterium]